MHNQEINRVNNNLDNIGTINTVTYILLFVSQTLQSIVLLSATILLATANIFLVVKYYQYASNKKQVINNFGKAKWKSLLSLLFAVAFIVIGIILIRTYIQ